MTPEILRWRNLTQMHHGITKMARLSIRDDRRIPEAMKVYARAESGRVYWNKRNALGQFVSWDGSQGSPEYDAYVEARIAHAEADTKGFVVNAAGRATWVGLSDLMRPHASLRYATEELKSWIARYGETLSYREFSGQSRY